MKKAELRFNKGRKQQIEDLAKPNTPQFYWGSNTNPIYIPKRKYKKRK